MDQMLTWAGIHPVLFTFLAICMLGASAAVIESVARIFYRR